MRPFDARRSCLAVLLLLALAAPEQGRAEAPPRGALDALWQEHMLTGSAATIYAEDGGQRTVATHREPFDEQRGVVSRVESAALTTHGIEVLKLDERWLLWRNGGWVMRGGLLARARGRASTIELYGKAVIRRPPWVSLGPFRRDPPTTTGYEFFLLVRKASVPRATVVRQWTVPPDDVGNGSPVRATLRYDAANRTATVTISGLKRPVDDTVGPLPAAD